MDTHVQKNMNNNNYKPSVGYDDFIGEFEEQMSNERDRILNNYDISQEDLENKFKKTYKNRYFNVVKNM
jgi:lipoate-protein ligase A